MVLKFSIITPSFRQLNWLKLCVASVADQEGVELEQIVQDAGTGPELEAWAVQQPLVKLHVEKDHGMYDAINRGLRRATGEILAYLNCDEQYLPGTLAAVERFFLDHPEVDVVFGDAVLVDSDGSYLCSRPVVLPHLRHTRVCTLGVFTAATFFRRRLLDEFQLYFNDDWKNLGDAVWILDLIRSGARMAVLRRFTSTFTDTGENLNLAPSGLTEKIRLRESAPDWEQRLRFLWMVHFRLRRLFAGIYFPEKLSYSIYTRTHPEKRQTFVVEKPSILWKSRL